MTTGHANMDAIHHAIGAQCCMAATCPKCGGRLHRQAIYNGFMELCEMCDRAEFDAPPTDADEYTGADYPPLDR
jgi:uncharacterized protein (DUF983 family)